jgi:hypothetical protein
VPADLEDTSQEIAEPAPEPIRFEANPRSRKGKGLPTIPPGCIATWHVVDRADFRSKEAGMWRITKLIKNSDNAMFGELVGPPFRLKEEAIAYVEGHGLHIGTIAPGEFRPPPNPDEVPPVTEPTSSPVSESPVTEPTDGPPVTQPTDLIGYYGGRIFKPDIITFGRSIAGTGGHLIGHAGERYGVFRPDKRTLVSPWFFARKEASTWAADAWIKQKLKGK